MTPPPAVEMQWQAPAACPDANSVRAATERLLGKSLDSAGLGELHASGEVAQNASGKWELHTRLVVGERVEEDTLVANRCSALSDAMALKVALALDPLAVVEAVQQTQALPAPLKRPEKSPAARARVHAREPAHFDSRTVGEVGLGPLPGTTPGVAVFASLEWPSFRIELGGEAFWAGVARYASPNQVGADLQLFAGVARGCVAPGTGPVRVLVCAGPELGVMRAHGFGVEETTVATGVWGGLLLGPALQWRMSRRLSLWVEADAGLTLLKPEFHMRNLPTLYASPAAMARSALGVEAKF